MAACAFSEEELLVGKGSLYDYADVFILYIVEEFCLVHKFWQDEQGHMPVIQFLSYRNQLYLEVFFAGILQIISRKVLNTKIKNLLGFYHDTVSMGCGNNQFEFGVKSADIHSRVGFGKTQVLCLLQS